MYVNPFLLGVLATIFAIETIILGAVIYYGIKN